MSEMRDDERVLRQEESSAYDFQAGLKTRTILQLLSDSDTIRKKYGRSRFDRLTEQKIKEKSRNANGGQLQLSPNWRQLLEKRN